LTNGAYAAQGDWTPDAWITTKAKLALMTNENVSASDVNVDTVDGRVTLHGKVPTAAAKEAASSSVQGIDGVSKVVNLLQVVPPAATNMVEVSDDEIKTDVERALAANSSLKDSDIDVASVNDGVVLLSGTADDTADHLEAVRVASAVSGVRRVSTEIEDPNQAKDVDENDSGVEKGAQNAANTVKDAASTTGEAIAGAGKTVGDAAGDAWITTKVKSRLLASSEAPALDVNVDTTDGNVTLFGTVDSAAAKAAAEKEARQADGVKSVKNLLQVVPKEQEETVARKDDEIEDQVEKELGNRKQFSNADIDVEVNDGVIRLTGTAPTSNVRLSAATVARSVQGVRSVTNDIEIESADRHASAD
jgi:osmotically-inducible protein OsmY